jgi:ABC-type transport system involved in cytochrome c biogenesis permease subunit
VHSPLLREVNVTMAGVLMGIGIVALFVLKRRASVRKHTLDRAYAQAMSDLAKRAKWSGFKALVIAVLIAVILLRVTAHA